MVCSNIVRLRHPFPETGHQNQAFSTAAPSSLRPFLVKRTPLTSATRKPSSFKQSGDGHASALEDLSGGVSSSPAPDGQNSKGGTRAKETFWQNLNLGLGQRSKKEEGTLVSRSGGIQIQWRDIVDPTPENLLALLLTGLLGLAGLQILWQLLLVAITITLAALKYSFIAAILLALLIIFL